MRYLLSFLIAVLFGFFSDARADEARTLFRCVTTEVRDASVFEESLSVAEYPRVSATADSGLGYELRIGASIYRSAQGARIEELNHGHNVTAIRLDRSIEIFVTEPHEGEDHLVGTITRGNTLVARLKCEL